MRAREYITPAPIAATAITSRIRLVVIDNQTLMRECLKALIEIEADLAMVGEFASMQEGLDAIRELQPDVLITDLALTGSSGLELLFEIQRSSPRTRILVLTAHDGQVPLCAASNAGADGYMLKNATSSELMLAIRTLSAGEQFLCQPMAAKRLSGQATRDRSPKVPWAAPSITGREREVLTRVALGLSNKMIARELGVCAQTVEKHRANLMRKLQLRNVAAVTMFAIRNGYTNSDPLAGIVAVQ